MNTTAANIFTMQPAVISQLGAAIIRGQHQ